MFFFSLIFVNPFECADYFSSSVPFQSVIFSNIDRFFNGNFFIISYFNINDAAGSQ